MSERLAKAMEDFAKVVRNLADDLRIADEDHQDGDNRQDGRKDWENVIPMQAAVGREVDGDAPTDDTLLEVSAGDLWRLVNRSRKMIRLAREGKVPTMEQRAPLCRSIKALKEQGLVRKPHNVRD